MKSRALEDYYYKIYEFYISCGQCGYTHTRESASYFLNGEHKLKECKKRGYGVAFIKREDAQSSKLFYATPITQKEIQKFRDKLNAVDVMNDQSYLIAFDEGFRVIYGNPPEEQVLSYEEMVEKHGIGEDIPDIDLD